MGFVSRIFRPKVQAPPAPVRQVVAQAPAAPQPKVEPNSNSTAAKERAAVQARRRKSATGRARLISGRTSRTGDDDKKTRGGIAIRS
jgi:hypothetical protein